MQPAEIVRPYVNGAAHHRVVAARAPMRDPFAGVLSIGDHTSWIVLAALAGALLIHGAAAVRTALIDPVLIDWSARTGDVIEHRLNAAIDVSFNKEPPPPPPPEETKDEEKPVESAPPPVLKEANPYEDVKPTEAPKPAAEASQILAANPSDELDFTGNTFVTGNAATYGGGSTTSAGTSKKAARTGGNGNGTSATATQEQVQMTGPDRSRSISLAGSSDWKCPWPSEADAENIDESAVTIEVAVGTDGRAQKVSVLKDPGFGFGREAKACAMRQSYNTALDRDGKPIAASKKFSVHFER